MDSSYELDDGGSLEILGTDGQVYRATLGLARPDDPRGPAVAEVHYSAPDVRGSARAIFASDVIFHVSHPGIGDEYDTLAEMAIDMIPDTHPLAHVRDAAKTKKHAGEVLASLV